MYLSFSVNALYYDFLTFLTFNHRSGVFCDKLSFEVILRLFPFGQHISLECGMKCISQYNITFLFLALPILPKFSLHFLIQEQI